MSKKKYNNSLIDKRIGEQKIANNGMTMTIVCYRGSSDIDVQFEDGTIVKHRRYNAFKTGSIKHPHHRVRQGRCFESNRVGEVSKASNGLNMKIIEYRSANDLDIQFEDGVIIEHKSYRRFKQGSIKHPTKANIHKQVRSNSGYVGMKGTSLEGDIIEITEYNDFQDIKVKFPDGFILDKARLKDFKAGRVSRYNNHIELDNERRNRVGTKNIMRNGMEATVIRYNRCKDIDVQFSDGYIVEHTKWSNFKRGLIRHPYNINRYKKSKIYKQMHEGEISVNTHGRVMKILEYNNCNDIKIQFDDGVIVEHKTYGSFKDGYIRHPDDKTVQQKYEEERTGLEVVNKQGLKMKIIKYNNYKNVDVQFENGVIKQGVSYSAFINGNITTHKRVTKGKKLKVKEDRTIRLGETNVANNGMSMTIIEYRGSTDIDVQFEDGTIVCNKYYSDFKKGLIRNPNLIHYEDDPGVKDVTNSMYLKARDKHLGQQVVSRCGLKAKVIEYYGTRNMTVQFEDGEIVTNISYSQFSRGSVKHPRFSNRADFYRNVRLGETNKNSYGLLMKIIEYNNFNDITVEFEDGTIVPNIRYNNFISGMVNP